MIQDVNSNVQVVVQLALVRVRMVVVLLVLHRQALYPEPIAQVVMRHVLLTVKVYVQLLALLDALQHVALLVETLAVHHAPVIAHRDAMVHVKLRVQLNVRHRALQHVQVVVFHAPMDAWVHVQVHLNLLQYLAPHAILHVLLDVRLHVYLSVKTHVEKTARTTVVMNAPIFAKLIVLVIVVQHVLQAVYRHAKKHVQVIVHLDARQHVRVLVFLQQTLVHVLVALPAVLACLPDYMSKIIFEI